MIKYRVPPRIRNLRWDNKQSREQPKKASFFFRKAESTNRSLDQPRPRTQVVATLQASVSYTSKSTHFYNSRLTRCYQSIHIFCRSFNSANKPDDGASIPSAAQHLLDSLHTKYLGFLNKIPEIHHVEFCIINCIASSQKPSSPQVYLAQKCTTLSALLSYAFLALHLRKDQLFIVVTPSILQDNLGAFVTCCQQLVATTLFLRVL